MTLTNKQTNKQTNRQTEFQTCITVFYYVTEMYVICIIISIRCMCSVNEWYNVFLIEWMRKKEKVFVLPQYLTKTKNSFTNTICVFGGNIYILNHLSPYKWYEIQIVK